MSLLYWRVKSIEMSISMFLLFFASVCADADAVVVEVADTKVLAALEQERALPERSLRLPNTTYPLRYHLHFSSNIHLAELEYTANVTIDIAIRKSTNEIVLNSKKLSNFTISVRDLASGELMDDLTYTVDTHANYLVIHPIENYQAFEEGQQLRVEILYAAIMNRETFGLYWLTYNDVDNRTVYLAATQFEPTSARLAFPCYDEPAFKSNFSIRLTHGSNYMAISNMQVLKVQEHGVHDNSDNSLTTTTFYTTPPISTYLVAFVISNFDYISEENRGVTQRIYAPPNTVDKGHKALKNAVRTVAAFEDYFGVNYPLVKLDHIALKKNYGAAMENWGLITYKEDNLMEQGDGEWHSYSFKYVLTQNHEIAHQWFGNLVSPEWWTYAWLNEGFATYFGYIITDLLYPEEKVMDFFLTDIAERAYSYNYIKARPMSAYVEKEKEILSIFDIISYQKAACVIKMFHHAFNQKTLVRGISMFLRKFQYTVANELQLFDSIQQAVAEDATLNQHEWSKSVSDIMQSWTHSEWIPIVSVVRNYEENTITIRQRSKNLQSVEHWWIPLNFAVASAPDFQNTQVEYFMPPVPEVTLRASELGIDLHHHDWLIVNKQQTGFYHVLYDEKNLWMIAKKLQQNHTAIHELNRAAIFQDLAPLIENNELKSVDVIFELMKYLQHEEDLMPWIAVADTAEFFARNLYGSPSHTLYKQFLCSLIKPIFLKVYHVSHTNSNLTNTEVLAHKNIMEIACSVDLQECLDYTHQRALEYIFGNTKINTSTDYYTIYNSILCLGLKYLSDDEFTSILDLLWKSNGSLLYDDLIYSLRCTRSSAHLRQYLNVLLGENSTRYIMDESDAMMYLVYLYTSNLQARPIMWHFLERNYRTLCHLPSFLRTFNIIAEYIPQQHRNEFICLRQAIATELQSTGQLISSDSPRIGKKVQISEVFVEKFGYQIQQWLLRNQRHQAGSTYVASIADVRNSAARIGSVTRMAGSLFRNLILSVSL